MSKFYPRSAPDNPGRARFSRDQRPPVTLDPDGQMALRRGLIMMAMREVPSAAIGGLVAAMGTAGVVWYGAPRGPLLAWLCAMIAVSLLRLRRSVSTRRMIPDAGQEALSRRVAANAVLAEVNGLLWGVLVPVFSPHDNLVLRAVVSCVVVVMAVTAIGSFAALPAAGQRFLFAAMVPLGVSNLIDVAGRTGVLEFLICVALLALICGCLRKSAAGVTETVIARLRTEPASALPEGALVRGSFDTFGR